MQSKPSFVPRKRVMYYFAPSKHDVIAKNHPYHVRWIIEGYNKECLDDLKWTIGAPDACSWNMSDSDCEINARGSWSVLWFCVFVQHISEPVTQEWSRIIAFFYRERLELLEDTYPKIVVVTCYKSQTAAYHVRDTGLVGYKRMIPMVSCYKPTMILSVLAFEACEARRAEDAVVVVRDSKEPPRSTAVSHGLVCFIVAGIG